MITEISHSTSLSSDTLDYTDWTRCFICQSKDNKILQNPTQKKGKSSSLNFKFSTHIISRII